MRFADRQIAEVMTRDRHIAPIAASTANNTGPWRSMSTMRICVDARMLKSDGTGVARYARTLVDSLTEVGVQPMLLHADINRAAWFKRWAASIRWKSRFAGADDRDLTSGIDGSGLAISAHDLFREAQNHFNLYGRLMPVQCDGPPGVMHWVYPIPLTMHGWRNVYTVHDVIPLGERNLSPIQGSRYRRLLQAIAHNADRLVTISETAQREIVNALGCDTEFVSNLSQAVSVHAEGPVVSDVAAAGDYFLFCGTIEPRKNLQRLADAYRQSGSTRKLVVVGPDGWRSDSIHQSLNTDGIIILPFQSRERLMRLMRDARALLFPSLAEGFGLPIAEAMTLGTPVMTSAGGATAEVAGDAAMLIDPYDVNAMATGIHLLSSDDLLCDRLSIAGRGRSAAFRTKPYAQRLIGLYTELLGIANHGAAPAQRGM